VVSPRERQSPDWRALRNPRQSGDWRSRGEIQIRVSTVLGDI